MRIQFACSHPIGENGIDDCLYPAQRRHSAKHSHLRPPDVPVIGRGQMHINHLQAAKLFTTDLGVSSGTGQNFARVVLNDLLMLIPPGSGHHTICQVFLRLGQQFAYGLPVPSVGFLKIYPSIPAAFRLISR